jgi:hypothetical protein
MRPQGVAAAAGRLAIIAGLARPPQDRAPLPVL